MNSVDDSANGQLDSILAQLNGLISNIPTVLFVILILTIGWIVARLAKRLVRQLATSLNRWLSREYPTGALSSVRLSSSAAALLSVAVFWGIILIAVTMAARFAEFGSLSLWLSRITTQLPNLFAAIGIVIAGYFLSIFARELLQSGSTTGSYTSNSVIGEIAQAVIVVLAVIIGLDQVGIDVALLIGLAVVLTAGIVTALAVAFVSGARSHISNLIGARTAHENLSEGMAIEIGNVYGEIIEITPTLIALDTDQGRVLVPGKFADDMLITVSNAVSSPDPKND